QVFNWVEAGHSILSTPKFWRYSVMILSVGGSVVILEDGVRSQILEIWDRHWLQNLIPLSTEYQQNNIAGDFGTFFWAATHTVSCVAHSTNARSLQVVPRCKGDSSGFLTIRSQAPPSH